MKKISKVLSVLLMLILLTSCSSDDDLQTEIVATLNKEQLIGTWKISYFENQVERTNDYDGILLFINGDNEIYAFVDEFDVFGTFDLYKAEIDNQTPTVIEMLFTTQENSPTSIKDKFRELNEEWIVKKVLDNATKIELEERISNNRPEKLHLEKVELIN